MGTSMKTVRLYTNNAFIPLLSTQVGRNVMMTTNGDSQYVTTNQYGGYSSDRDVGIPTVCYMHNMLPVAHGIKSVGFDVPLAGGNATNNNSRIIELRTCTEKYRHCSITPDGNVALIDGVWVNLGGIVSSSPYTYAHHHKTSYLMHEYTSLQYLTELDTLVPVFPAGIDLSKIKGVTHANNYLILYTEDTIHYSNVLPVSADSMDFVPSLDTMAASIMPLHLRGAITFCLQSRNGFTIFTTQNIVEATYTGNPTEPFRYSEMYASGGVLKQEHITHLDNAEIWYCWSTKGLLEVPKDGTECSQILPEITDFLHTAVYEEFIGETDRLNTNNKASVWDSWTQSYNLIGNNRLIQSHTNDGFETFLSFINSRYLMISYKPYLADKYQYCVVYDVILKRYGKLRIGHACTFDFKWNRHNANIAFLGTDGVVTMANLENSNTCIDSILIFDKISPSKSKATTLHSVAIENTEDINTSLIVFTALDGKNGGRGLLPMRQQATRNNSRWLMRTTGMSHGFMLIGYVELISICVEFTTSGSK